MLIFIRLIKIKFILLHCVSSYPSSNESVNLLSLKTISSSSIVVGYSDHSQGSFASMASVALGGVVIEKHFTTSKRLPGPDQKTSCLPMVKKLVEDVNNFNLILGSKNKKYQPEEKEMKLISKKTTLKNSLKKGEIIKLSHLTLKRPGKGLYYINLKKIVGKKVRKNLKKDHQINFKDLI